VRYVKHYVSHHLLLPELLGICFLREAPERSIGAGWPASRLVRRRLLDRRLVRRLVRRSLGVGGSLLGLRSLGEVGGVGGSLLGLRSLGEVGGVGGGEIGGEDWRAGKWEGSPCGGADSKTCPNSSRAFISTLTTEK
jgi:hypothetical protein